MISKNIFFKPYARHTLSRPLSQKFPYQRFLTIYGGSLQNFSTKNNSKLTTEEAVHRIKLYRHPYFHEQAIAVRDLMRANELFEGNKNNQAEIYLNLAENFLFHGELAEAQEYFTKATKLFSELQKYQEHFYCEEKLADLACRQDIGNGLKAYDAILNRRKEHFQPEKDSGLSLLWALRGQSLFRIRKVEESLDCLEQSQKLLSIAETDPICGYYTYSSIGLFYELLYCLQLQKMKRFEKLSKEEYLPKSAENYIKAGAFARDPYEHFLSHYKAGLVFTEQGEYLEALKTFDLAIEKVKEMPQGEFFVGKYSVGPRRREIILEKIMPMTLVWIMKN